MFLLSTLLSTLTSTLAADENCPRYSSETTGSSLINPTNIHSSHGYLDVHTTYETRYDDHYNITLFCYMTDDNLQSPTLRAHPGDTILFTLKNNAYDGEEEEKMELPDSCGSKWIIKPSATNIHFHGLHSPPLCHIEDVTFTVINYGEEYTYDLQIPITQSPGLYWYHPHIHGIVERAVQGGATGAIIIEGIENVQPATAGLPEQILIIRDYSSSTEVFPHPAFEITTNYHYVPYPDYTPPTLAVQPNQKQFWRILNAASDALFELQFVYDGVVQPFDIVSHDGVIHRDHHNHPSLLTSQKSVELMAAGRVELIVEAPGPEVTSAYLRTLAVDTGPIGDHDPERNILQLIPDTNAPAHEIIIPQPTHHTHISELSIRLMKQTPIQTRKLYFSSAPESSEPDSDTVFFLTVEGQTPTAFTMEALYHAASITAEAGTIEDWIIENRAMETHVFHIHQLHFLLLERDGLKVPPNEIQFYDTVSVPYWDGVSTTYPSITIRIYFSPDIIGKFVYHCHILEHEDKGMMALIEVVKPQEIESSSSHHGLTLSAIYQTNSLFLLHNGIVILGVLTLLMSVVVIGISMMKRKNIEIPIEQIIDRENGLLQDVSTRSMEDNYKI